MDRLISEQAVLETIATWVRTSEPYDRMGWLTPKYLYDRIKAIPSAEPREVLYSGDGYADGYMVYDMAECPNCGYKYEDGDKDWGLSFCPSCGQKLNWESEDKE